MTFFGRHRRRQLRVLLQGCPHCILSHLQSHSLETPQQKAWRLCDRRQLEHTLRSILWQHTHRLRAATTNEKTRPGMASTPFHSPSHQEEHVHVVIASNVGKDDIVKMSIVPVSEISALEEALHACAMTRTSAVYPCGRDEISDSGQLLLAFATGSMLALMKAVIGTR